MGDALESRTLGQCFLSEVPSIRMLPAKVEIRNRKQVLGRAIRLVGQERHVFAANVHVGKHANSDGIAWPP